MRFNEFKNVNENLDNILGAIMGKAGIDITAGNKTTDANNISMDVNKPASDTTFKAHPGITLRTSTGIEMPANGSLTSPFGQRARGMHWGTDIAVPVGTPVKAPEDCFVGSIDNNSIAGLHVNLTDGAGRLKHRLLHLSQVKVKLGQLVRKGDVVALSGNSGNSTGPHLHWEKYVAGRPVDPMKYIG
jgi:murein DD-endopeptidase MepM/ murein hydrolase activator NlpD